MAGPVEYAAGAGIAQRTLTNVMLLMKKVANPRNPFMTNPARMHLISDMPDPAAYFANERTKCAATKENRA